MQQPDNTNSKEKILDAAGKLFAEKGYKQTTVREICKEADTYQLSINYHFGSKENLFKEVLQKTYNDTEEFQHLEEIKAFSAEKQLEEIIRTRLISIFSEDKSSIFFKIIAKEASNNYDLIDTHAFSSLLLPHFEFTKTIFRQLSKNTFNEYELNYCSYLLMSHISLLTIHKRATNIFFNKEKPENKDIEKFVQQVKSFILAGVQNSIQHIEG